MSVLCICFGLPFAARNWNYLDWNCSAHRSQVITGIFRQYCNRTQTACWKTSGILCILCAVSRHLDRDFILLDKEGDIYCVVIESTTAHAQEVVDRTMHWTPKQKYGVLRVCRKGGVQLQSHLFGEGSEALKEHLQGCSVRPGWGRGGKLRERPRYKTQWVFVLQTERDADTPR